MNIHLPAILMFTRGTRFWHTATSYRSRPRRNLQVQLHTKNPLYSKLWWSAGTRTLRSTAPLSNRNERLIPTITLPLVITTPVAPSFTQSFAWSIITPLAAPAKHGRFGTRAVAPMPKARPTSMSVSMRSTVCSTFRIRVERIVAGRPGTEQLLWPGFGGFGIGQVGFRHQVIELKAHVSCAIPSLLFRGVHGHRLCSC